MNAVQKSRTSLTWTRRVVRERFFAKRPASLGMRYNRRHALSVNSGYDALAALRRTGVCDSNAALRPSAVGRQVHGLVDDNLPWHGGQDS
jgi:hypothetical protein